MERNTLLMAKQTGSPHTRILKELKKKQIKKIEVTNGSSFLSQEVTSNGISCLI